ncbi:MAG: hypothetical protein DME96_07340, partial [Verrucomicrobia bacterium]
MREAAGARAKPTLADDLMGFARTNPDRICGQANAGDCLRRPYRPPGVRRQGAELVRCSRRHRLLRAGRRAVIGRRRFRGQLVPELQRLEFGHGVVGLQGGVDLAAGVVEVRGGVLTVRAEQAVALVFHAELAHVPGDV